MTFTSSSDLDLTLSDFSSPLHESQPTLDETITLTEEQQKVLTLAESGSSFLVSGGAGTGKSFALRYVVSRLRELHGDHVVVTASTGIAAVQVSGITLHSFAGIGITTDDSDVRGLVRKMPRTKKQRWKEIRCLFDLLEDIARTVRQNNRPFGGIQLILFGDFLQLPPVKPARKQTPFAFQAESWPGVIDQVIELKQCIRQVDPVFISLLKLIRVGDTSPPVIKMLNKIYQKTISEIDSINCSPSTDRLSEIEHTLLYCTNKDVDAENLKRLQQLPRTSEQMTYEAQDGGKEQRSFRNQLAGFIPDKITLKVGAQVMLVKNLSVSDSLCNGARGVVIGFDNRMPQVKFASGCIKTIERHTFQIEDKGITVASRSQIPLKLAWSITIHKSQGMTVEKMATSLQDVFESAQFYVALSRCPSMENLHLLAFSQKSIKVHPVALTWIRGICPEMFANLHKDLAVLSLALRGPDHNLKETRGPPLSQMPKKICKREFDCSQYIVSNQKSISMNYSAITCPIHRQPVSRARIIDGVGKDEVFFVCNSYPACSFVMLFAEDSVNGCAFP
ncbi:hypothetical protein GEMRC1_002187 [Eukaryota sp. GEM-RC1]